ncbi:NEAT domain-containing protein [Leuconostocaceae bacterium ESL0723]|nr:NEAT domain-containing protein [Leuconostocaceae bacterium ESL0723]
MMKIRKGLVGLVLVLAVAVTGFASQAQADDPFNVNFRAVKDGAESTSVSDRYFVKPGQAAVVGDHYEVILTIRTDHSLGLFPVQVTDFNGQQPEVARTTQGNTDFYQFKFTTTTLTQRLNGHMTVNIPSIRYDHYYAFGIEFDANGTPAIGGGQNSGQAESSSDDDQQSAAAQSSSEAASKTPKPQTTPKAAIKYDKKDKAANKPLPWWPFAVVVGLAVVIGVVAEFRYRQKGDR